MASVASEEGAALSRELRPAEPRTEPPEHSHSSSARVSPTPSSGAEQPKARGLFSKAQLSATSVATTVSHPFRLNLREHLPDHKNPEKDRKSHFGFPTENFPFVSSGVKPVSKEQQGGVALSRNQIISAFPRGTLLQQPTSERIQAGDTNALDPADITNDFYTRKHKLIGSSEDFVFGHIPYTPLHDHDYMLGDSPAHAHSPAPLTLDEALKEGLQSARDMAKVASNATSTHGSGRVTKRAPPTAVPSDSSADNDSALGDEISSQSTSATSLFEKEEATACQQLLLEENSIVSVYSRSLRDSAMTCQVHVVSPSRLIFAMPDCQLR